MGKPLIKAFWFWQESKQEKEAAWVTWNAEVEAFDKLWWERCLMSPEQGAAVGVLMGWLKWPWKQWLSLHLPFLSLAERVYTELAKYRWAEPSQIFSDTRSLEASLHFTGHVWIPCNVKVLGIDTVFRVLTKFYGRFLKMWEEENFKFFFILHPSAANSGKASENTGASQVTSDRTRENSIKLYWGG